MCPSKGQPDQRSARDGFRMEDCLAAEYLAAMLSPRSIPDLRSPIEKVQVQGRSLGGDDVILHHQDGHRTFIQSKLTIDGLSPSSAFGKGFGQLLDQYLLHLKDDPETGHRYSLAYVYDNTAKRLSRFRQWLRYSRGASEFKDVEEYAGRGNVHLPPEDSLKRDEEFLTLFEDFERAALKRAGREGETLKDPERMGFLRRLRLLPIVLDVEFEEFTANTVRYLGDVLDDSEAIIQAAKNLIYLANSNIGATLDIEMARSAANIPAPVEQPKYAQILGVPVPVGDFLDRDFGVATRGEQETGQRMVESVLDLIVAGSQGIALTGHVGLSGMGGVGKTVLATELCHRLAAREDWAGGHTGGVLWIAAGFEHGEDRGGVDGSFKADERLILLRLARLLGAEPDPNTDDPDNAALRGSLRGELQSRDGGLLVLDNLEDGNILSSFRSFLPQGWQLVVTSRRKDLEGFADGKSIALDCYTPDEAIDYFSQPGVLGELTDSGRVAARRLHQISGGLPLVCSVVAESVKWGVDTLEKAVNEVARERARLMATEVPAQLEQVLKQTGAEGLDPQNVATVYASMRQGLAAVRRGPYGEMAEKLFAALVPFDPLTGGPVSLIFRSAEVEDLPEAKPALENLTRANLIENRSVSPLPGLPQPERRFGLHPVIRLMAEKEFKNRRDGLETHWLLSLITRAEEGSRLIGERTQTGVDLQRIEASNLKLLVERCLLDGSRATEIRRLSALAVAWYDQLIRLTWPVGEVEPVLRAAVEQLESGVHRLENAWLIEALGDLSMRTSDLGGARAHYEQALPLFREIEDRLGEANTLQGLALLAVHGDPVWAVRMIRAVREFHAEIENQLGEQACLGYEARFWMAAENPARALWATKTALTLGKRASDLFGQKLTLNTQADAFNGVKNAPGFLACWYRELEICRQINDPEIRQHEERWKRIREIEDEEGDHKKLIQFIEDDAEAVRQAAYEHSSKEAGEEEKKAYESLMPATMQEIDEWLQTGKVPEDKEDGGNP